jgi:predicted enzyme related to lactoylglutathione lyase
MTIKATRDLLIQIDDLKVATAFYEETLGLSVFMRSPGMTGLEAGALRLFLEEGAPLGPIPEFLTPDVAALRDRLVAAGCAVVEENPAIPRCYIRDPYGMVFNLGPA